MQDVLNPVPPASWSSASRRRLLALVGPLIGGPVWLAGCGSASPGRAPPAGDGGRRFDPPAAPAPLGVEERWLRQWFDGTPVQIVRQRDGALAVTVPATFCFDPGRHAVKPPLAAVLDKVAESLRRQRQARLDALAVPADAEGDAALLRRRGLAVRDHLRARGVDDARLAQPATMAASGVRLQLRAPPTG